MSCKSEKFEVVISLRTCIAVGLLFADTFREGAVFRREGEYFVEAAIAEASDCCKQADIFIDVLNGVHDVGVYITAEDCKVFTDALEYYPIDSGSIIERLYLLLRTAEGYIDE